VDLLANIESQIRSVSSERRLMASPDSLESMASAKVLTAAGHSSEEADTLRRADGLAVRRLGWSIQLRAVEMLARDLRRDDWKTERAKFYEFAHAHILRPDKILKHLDYLPRLLSLAVALTDWPAASRLVEGATAALQKLAQATDEGSIRVNGVLNRHRQRGGARDDSQIPPMEFPRGGAAPSKQSSHATVRSSWLGSRVRGYLRSSIEL
jgi:hypothetical protein